MKIKQVWKKSCFVLGFLILFLWVFVWLAWFFFVFAKIMGVYPKPPAGRALGVDGLNQPFLWEWVPVESW